MEQDVKNPQQTQANDHNPNEQYEQYEQSKSILIGYEELNKKLDELIIKLRSKKKKKSA